MNKIIQIATDNDGRLLALLDDGRVLEKWLNNSEGNWTVVPAPSNKMLETPKRRGRPPKPKTN